MIGLCKNDTYLNLQNDTYQNDNYIMIPTKISLDEVVNANTVGNTAALTQASNRKKIGRPQKNSTRVPTLSNNLVSPPLPARRTGRSQKK